MGLTLVHSEARVLAALLVGVGQLGDPTLSQTWPITVGVMPNEPDNCVMVDDTTGQSDGREMVGGEVLEHPGLQFVIRSTDHKTGHAKARSLRDYLAKSVYGNNLTVADEGFGAATYCVWGVYKIKNIIYVGRELPKGHRYLHTLNCITFVERIS